MRAGLRGAASDSVGLEQPGEDGREDEVEFCRERHGGVIDRDPQTGLYPYLGYLVEANGFRLYHAGDTCLYEGMHALLRAQPCDLFILPINGRDGRRLAAGCIGNMTWQEAADLAGELAPGTVIPAHYDMFQGNMAPVDEFVEYMRLKYPAQRVVTPGYAEAVMLKK